MSVYLDNFFVFYNYSKDELDGIKNIISPLSLVFYNLE